MLKKSALVLLSLSLLTTACVRTSTRRPLGQTVSGVGEARSPELAALQAQPGLQLANAGVVGVPQWAAGELTASASAPSQTVTPGEETRRLLARRSALHLAYRELAQQVENTPTGSGQTIGSLAGDPAVRMQVEKIVYQARVVEEAELPTGMYYVKLALPLGPFAQLFPGGAGGAYPMAGQTYQQQVDYYREQVRQAAERNARDNLMNKVKESRSAKARRRIIDDMEEDQGYEKKVREAVQSAPAQAPQFGADGSCRVTITLNLDTVRSS